MNLGWQHRHTACGEGASWTGFYQSAGFAAIDVVRRHLAQVMPERELDSITIANVWLVPSKRLVVVYRMGRPSKQDDIVTVQFCRRGESGAVFSEAQRNCAKHGGLLHLPAWDAIAWLFPTDQALPHLRAMLDPVQVANTVRSTLDLRPNGLFGWRLLSYLPTRRCALHYRWDGSSDELVGKLGEGACDSHRRLARIWLDPGRNFLMPEPIAACPDLGARWERFVDGDRIDNTFSGESMNSHLAAVGAALVGLHSMRTDGLPERGATRILSRIERKVLPRIEAALPALAPRAKSLVQQLADGLDGVSRRRLHTVHGDLHTANLLVNNERVVFIDLDDLALGDAAYDLALLGSRLLLAQLSGRIAVEDIGSIVAALPVHYERQGGDPVPEDVFAWYMAALLVGRQIKTCIRHLAPDLPVLAGRLLTLAERTLAKGQYDGSQA